VAANRPACARLLAVTPAGRSAASYTFPLGCRCQGVGNWELPGGVMLRTPSRQVDDSPKYAAPCASWRPVNRNRWRGAYIGAFDQAARLLPTRHIFPEERLPWLHLTDA
jgi:hypothetical protein